MIDIPRSMFSSPAAATGAATAGSRQLSAADVAEAEQTFSTFDFLNTGLLSYRALKVALRALGYPVKKREVLLLLDKHKANDRADLPAFLAILRDKVLARSVEEEYSRAFELFDLDSTGQISIANLRDTAAELGLAIPDDDLIGMINEFGKGGTVNEQDFKAIAVLQHDSNY